MSDIIAIAEAYRNEISLKAQAHELSSEWHRGKGAMLGIIATALSTLISTSIFVAIATQVREGKFDVHDWRYWVIASIGGFLLAISPVLSGIQTYLKHPEQAATHKVSYVKYSRLKQQLDLFILKYKDITDQPEIFAQAIGDLDAISKCIEEIALESITLTPRAYTDARNTLMGKPAKPWWMWGLRLFSKST